MPLVMNCLERENQVTIGGNTFTFSPKQIKEIHNPDIASEIVVRRQHLGFTGLPEELAYLTHIRKGQPAPVADPEHEELIRNARQEGVNAYVNNLRRIIYNEQVSLKQDMERMNDKSDPRLMMKPQMVKNMEELVKYQTAKEDLSQQQVDKIKELEKKISAVK